MRPLVCLIACFAVAAPAASAMDMGMGSPEHVASALAQLKAHHNAKAKHFLKLAISTKAEPKAARDHAKEALTALNGGKRTMAIDHATNGAAVEHLTYALSALQAKKIAEGRMHLMEAKDLAPYAADAGRALAALKAGHRAQAISIVREALAEAVAAD
jgi:hypothetical protein